ncbi:hypothetical protein [Rhizobium sp. LjRoot258]|uniref:hypothetical protein n=1 Tax=Rhizobium sp. LjRoot258 TaxID=3342299 RepID=UPI003ECEC40C
MMTDYSDDSGHAHRLDDIIRASWPAPPPVSFSGAEIERKGLMIAYEDDTRIVLARIATTPRTTIFRGSREEAAIFLAGLPDAGPPKHTDPLAPIRAEADSMLATIAADAAADVRKREG